MSHTALQRVLVRMLYDPALVRAVYRDAEAALAGVDLSPAERSWLTEADPRAYGTDPWRRARSLKALIEEFPVSAALCPGGAARLDAYFSSDAFHGAIQARRSMALSFGDWLLAGLAGQGPGLRAAVAVLERAFAELRRAGEAPPPAGEGLVLAPGIRLLDLPLGALLIYTELRDRLGSDPVSVLVSPGFTPPSAPPLPAQTEAVLIDGRDGLTAELAPEGLVALLRAVPAPRATLLATARSLGAEPGEDAEILDALIAQGLLIDRQAPTPGEILDAEAGGV